MHLHEENSAAGTVPKARDVILIMGVAGSGKTTVGEALARELGWEFRDADDFHPPANIAKMSAGIPLDDTDRQPWLAAIRRHIDAALLSRHGVVITCSALKERYRQIVVPASPRVGLVHLTGSFDLILERMRQRQGHFMKAEMLRSQFDALEPPANAFTVGIELSVPEVVRRIRGEFGV